MKSFCRIRNLLLALLAALAFCVSAAAEITFSSPNLSEENELLFALTHKISGSAEYTTVFKSKIVGLPGSEQAFGKEPLRSRLL